MRSPARQARLVLVCMCGVFASSVCGILLFRVGRECWCCWKLESSSGFDVIDPMETARHLQSRRIARALLNALLRHMREVDAGFFEGERDYDESPVTLAACRALRRSGSISFVIDEMLRDDDDRIVWCGLMSIGRSLTAERSFDVLRLSCSDRVPWGMVHSVLYNNFDVVVPAFCEAIRSDDAELRRLSLRAIAWLGVRAAPCLGTLQNMKGFGENLDEQQLVDDAIKAILSR